MAAHAAYQLYSLTRYGVLPLVVKGGVHRRTGRCGVLAIATWAAWFRAAQGWLLTKKKEEKKGEKGKRRKKEEERKEKEKREEKKGKKT